MDTDNNFYVATSGALPWREPDNVTLPAIEWSSLAFSSSHFSRKAVVPDPSSLIAAEDGDTESVRDFKDFDGVALRGVARHIGGVESVVDAYELEELARLGERAARDVVVEEVVSV
eukprot:CAMPEP_0182826198 /NCGR_PEP_ID=MMETSP0006_2-20121128/16245_1 /TAXON_ID=97485 /ORGANISM="Prymnesium parvum, Strain Texoma1" /LENGTH=115 /DNA_ID=CAMNT_0024953345 /DNA_START=1112 /DNA_END=1458 /DNA_ORIENTATION=-